MMPPYFFTTRITVIALTLGVVSSATTWGMDTLPVKAEWETLDTLGRIDKRLAAQVAELRVQMSRKKSGEKNVKGLIDAIAADIATIEKTLSDGIDDKVGKLRELIQAGEDPSWLVVEIASLKQVLRQSYTSQAKSKIFDAPKHERAALR